MFEAIFNITKNIRKLTPQKLLRESLDNSQIRHDIIALNQEQLYDKGVFADGKPTGEYSPATIYGTIAYEGKIKKGQRYDHITFKDTGALYESFKLKNTNDGFIIEANTMKGGGTINAESSIPSTKGRKYKIKIEGEDLEKQYGHPLVGLTNESLAEVRDWVIPIARDKALESIMK